MVFQECYKHLFLIRILYVSLARASRRSRDRDGGGGGGGRDRPQANGETAAVLAQRANSAKRVFSFSFFMSLSRNSLNSITKITYYSSILYCTVNTSNIMHAFLPHLRRVYNWNAAKANARRARRGSNLSTWYACFCVYIVL